MPPETGLSNAIEFALNDINYAMTSYDGVAGCYAIVQRAIGQCVSDEDVRRAAEAARKTALALRFTMQTQLTPHGDTLNYYRIKNVRVSDANRVVDQTQWLDAKTPFPGQQAGALSNSIWDGVEMYDPISYASFGSVFGGVDKRVGIEGAVRVHRHFCKDAAALKPIEAC